MVSFIPFQNVRIYLAFHMYFAMDCVDRFIGLLPNWVKFMDSAAIKRLSTRERYQLSPFTIWKSI